MPFSDYNRDPAQYPFLDVFQNNWTSIRDEYNNFAADDKLDKNLLYRIMSPHTDVIKAKNASQYSVLGLSFHGKSIVDFLRQYQLSWPGIDLEEIDKLLKGINEKYFPITTRCMEEARAQSQDRVRTVYFSVYSPGLDIKLHVNRDLHEYRGYLGLYVPEGDVAMQICNETLKWENGRFMILDHNFPHCPHNRTGESRVVLIVDFLKPDQPLEEMLALEKRVVDERMKSNPHGYGVFGTDDVVPDEMLIKYGLAHQLEWNKGLV